MRTAPRRVPTRYFMLLLDALGSQGIDTEQLLGMAGLETREFDSHEGMLRPEQVEALIASARRLTGRTDLGFELGRRIKTTSHELLGYGMLSCRNLDEMLRLAVRHYHLLTETFTLRYRRNRGVGEAVYTPTLTMPLEMLHFYYEALATAHENQVRMLCGGDSSYDIYLAMPPPPHARRYFELAPVRFHFDEFAPPGVRAVMGAELLDRPFPMANPRVVEKIDEQCGALGQRPPTGETGWGSYVMMMLRETKHNQLTLEDLAQRAQVSPRTIDRYLKKENLNFRDLSQQVRFQRARELLCVPGATVANVARNLGFRDAANFSRAFRRVMGMSPSDYQRNSNAK
ncbi:MAG TPA: AraC family transcriptional regulator ligand-binding domain-containing protein [Burkholderiaceae bacterium]|nr:AraC family transcriptional regulator ligand-binding domain-containing protein [Burkholderiaceae bacterium]